MKFKIEDAKKEFTPVKVEIVFETLGELIAFNFRVGLTNIDVDKLNLGYYGRPGSWRWERAIELWKSLDNIITQYTGTNGRGGIN